MKLPILTQLTVAAMTVVALSNFVLSSAQAQTVAEPCTSVWDEAAAKNKEAETAFNNGKFVEAEELFKVATGRWLVAGQQCTGKNSDTAKANAELARESAAVAKRNHANQVCVAAEQNASNKFKEAIALFDKKDWQAAADGFGNVVGLFNKLGVDCPGPIGDLAKKNAEVVARNEAAATTNLKNAKLSATTAMVSGQCEGDVTAANKLGQNFSAAERGRDFPAMTSLANQLETLYKKIRLECADNDKAKTEFDERLKAMADVKKQIGPCGDAHKTAITTRDRLKSFANLPASTGYNDVVRKFRADVRLAQNVCFGSIFDAKDTANDSEADLLEDERLCLPALRKIAAKASGAPASANCKSRLFVEVEKTAKAK